MKNVNKLALHHRPDSRDSVCVFIYCFSFRWHFHSVDAIPSERFHYFYSFVWHIVQLWLARTAPQEFPFTFLPKTHQPEHQFLLHFKENLLFTIPKYVFCNMPLHLYLCLRRSVSVIRGLVLRENIFLILFLVFRRKYAHRNNDKRVSSSYTHRAFIPTLKMHCLFVLITDGKTYDPGTTAHAEKCIWKLRERTANVRALYELKLLTYF